MAINYIPGADPEFNNWQAGHVAYLTAHLADLGLVAGDLTPITAAQAKWAGDYTKHLNAIAAAKAARQAKDDSRAEFEAVIRPLVRRLQASPDVDDGERAALGITVPGAQPTPGGPPTGIPLLKVVCERLRHILHWTDSATPTRKAKPPGVYALEIRMALTAIGAPTPTDPEMFQFVAMDTATPNIIEFDGADGGKNAHYICRWVTATGEHGTWSETVSVTVGV